MKAIFPVIILLAACDRPAAPATNLAASEQPAARPAEPAAKPFVDDEKNELIDFHFGWSAEAAAVPQLVGRFRAEMEKAKAELISGAREDRAFRDKEGYDFHPHSSSTDYKTAGKTGRLLSLAVEVASYTGGAHGNYGTGALLWDRPATRDIKVADLFAASGNLDRLLTQRWCDALNKAREEKRGEPVSGGGMFDECPALGEISIIPTDKDGNGKFERLQLVADPYVAGPYAEGSYEIELPVTGELVAAIGSDYRESFEVQTQ